MTDICRWFRCRFQYQAMDILNCLQRQHFITFSRLARGKVIKYQIVDWKKTNRILEYNAPCQKDTGFFFICVAEAKELISLGRCAETDMFFDLWLHEVYNVAQARGSAIGPVVYFRNGSGNPLTNYAELAARWGVSKSTVGRTLEKFVRLGYLTVVAGTGKTGSAIYLHAYLSTMFQISDIMLDNEEIAMALHMVIRADEIKTTEPDVAMVQAEIPDGPLCVPKPVISCLVRKFLQLLAGQGFPCLSCGQCQCRLSIPDCGEVELYHLLLICESEQEAYRFEIRERKKPVI